MKWLGLLIICAVVTLVLGIAAWYGKKHKWYAIIITYLLVTGFLFGLASAVMFGVTLIMRG